MCGLREFMLRFAISETVLGSAASVELLEGLKRELKVILPSLREQENTLNPRMPLSARLALKSGVQGHEGLLEWCEYGLNEFNRHLKRS